MEILLLAIAGGVVYFLYITLKDYLNNQGNQSTQNYQNTYIDVQPESPKLSEFATISGILGYVANADGEICPLEKELGNSLILDMSSQRGAQSASELNKYFYSKEYDIGVLCENFNEITKGEYKKKLKIIEFCFALGYADGLINKATEEAIIDVGAFLQLDNEDFNKIYDAFKTMHFSDFSLTESEALELLDLEANFTQEELKKRYEEKISQTKQDILSTKSLNTPISNEMLDSLRKIQKAYEVLIKN